MNFLKISENEIKSNKTSFSTGSEFSKILE